EPHPLEQTLGRVERLSNTPQIRWEIASTDREALGRVLGPSIASRPEALAELVEGVNQAVALARTWAALQEARPGRVDEPSARETAEFRAALGSLRGPVRDEIVRTRQEQSAGALLVGLDQAAMALDSLGELLEASERHVPRPPREPSATMLLNAPLLRVPTANLDGDWNPESVPVDVVDRLAGLAETGRPDWAQAFAARLRSGDHQASTQILTYLEAGVEAETSIDVAALRASCEADLERRQHQLAAEIERTRDELDLAAAGGSLTDAERGSLQAVVESVYARPVAGQRRFGPALDHLAEVRRGLEQPAGRPNLPALAETPSRKSLLVDLATPDGPCLLVGRPGLGRHALLEDVARSCPPDGDRRTILLEVSREPALDVAVERFWMALDGSLWSQLGLPSLDAPSAELAVRQHVDVWLAANAGRRLLILLDESDALLDVERRLALRGSSERFPISRSLADLMDRADGRLKIVLAGWLDVQRVTRLPDYPLAVRGCRWLGPMLDHGEWDEAGVLAHELLTRAGAPAPPSVETARLLSLANYEPEPLARLAELVAQRAREMDGPADGVDQVRSSPVLGEARSLDTRHTALADRRFDVVLKLVALGCRGGTSSVSREQVRRQAIDWWAEGFGESWADDAFRELIDDMIGLRLLRPIGPGQLALHSPNLVSELGSAEELIAELSDYIEQPAGLDVEHDPRRDERRPCAAAPAGQAVLTAWQRATLDQARARVSVVFGTDAAGIAATSSCLDDDRRRVAVLDPVDRSEDRLRELVTANLRESRTGPVWLVLSGSWPSPLGIFNLLQDALCSHPNARAILLSGPEQTWELIGALADGSEVTLAEWLEAAGVDSYSLGPWSASVLNTWLAAPERAELPAHGLTMERLLNLTGGWPMLVEHLMHPPFELGPAARWLSAFGLYEPRILSVLRPLAELEEASAEMLGDILDPPLAADVGRVLEWARLLHLARPGGGGRWRLDPVLARLMPRSE
ncbi:MAG: hypothetical protein JO023_17345, partial [Chloroflexi bacterium]|nr:hypothetical protein [Chloroflexota bacterium]